MVSGIVVHVAANGTKHTEVLAAADYVRIGSAAESDLRLELPEAIGSAGILELKLTNGEYRVASFNHALDITLNQVPIKQDDFIRDGDVVRFGALDLELHFFPIANDAGILAPTRQRETILAPFIEQAAIESRATARRDDAKVFLREFTRELVKEINPSTKILAFLLTLSLVGGLLYLGFAGFRELQRSRRLMDAQNQQIKDLQEVLNKTNRQISTIEESNNDVISSLSLGANLRNLYGDGVCLISGTYIFVESGTGRPLRHPETSVVEDGTTIDDAASAATPVNPLPFTPEGQGPVAEFEINGTGFHVGDGYVLTNRHVVQPWLADERSMVLSSTVNARPKLIKLLASFPDRDQAYALRLRKVSEHEEDLAVCSLEVKEVPDNLPTLPLDRDEQTVRVGREVVMMGYPAGIDRMLASLPEAESRSLQERFGASTEALLNQLARRKRITPLTTQGHVTDLYSRRIVYDAATGEGASGSPVFGPSARVIGVNFAVFSGNNASNFAVPINFAMPLLADAGWSQPEPANERAQQQAIKPAAADATNSPVAAPK